MLKLIWYEIWDNDYKEKWFNETWPTETKQLMSFNSNKEVRHAVNAEILSNSNVFCVQFLSTSLKTIEISLELKSYADTLFSVYQFLKSVEQALFDILIWHLSCHLKSNVDTWYFALRITDSRGSWSEEHYYVYLNLLPYRNFWFLILFSESYQKIYQWIETMRCTYRSKSIWLNLSLTIWFNRK